MTDTHQPQPDMPTAPAEPEVSSSREFSVFGIKMPPLVRDTVHRVQDFGDRMRERTIRALPAFIVNNSSNAVAITQLTGEVMMFKANNTTFIEEAHKGTWWRYLTEPPKNIFGSVFKNAGISMEAKDLLRPSFYRDTAKSFVNLDAATAIDKAAGRTLINRWQARSSFTGLSAMAITAVVPDAKDTPEDLEKMATLSRTNPIAYIGERIRQGLWFPVETVVGLGQKLLPGHQGREEENVGKHKRQFTGLALTITGIFSFLSGFRNVGTIDSKLPKSLLSNQKYVRNAAHSWGGAITALAGSQLLTALDNDSGWSRFGAIQWLRMGFLPKSIINRYEHGDPKAHWYLGGSVGMQSANTVSYLIGGAQKLEDGTIVNHDAMRNSARARAKETVQQRKEQRKTHEDTPGTRVSAAVMDQPLEADALAR